MGVLGVNHIAVPHSGSGRPARLLRRAAGRRSGSRARTSRCGRARRCSSSSRRTTNALSEDPDEIAFDVDARGLRRDARARPPARSRRARAGRPHALVERLLRPRSGRPPDRDHVRQPRHLLARMRPPHRVQSSARGHASAASRSPRAAEAPPAEPPALAVVAAGRDRHRRLVALCSDSPSRARRRSCPRAPGSPGCPSAGSRPARRGRASSAAPTACATFPVEFRAGGRSWRIRPSALGVRSTGARASKLRAARARASGPSAACAGSACASSARDIHPPVGGRTSPRSTSSSRSSARDRPAGSATPRSASGAQVAVVPGRNGLTARPPSGGRDDRPRPRRASSGLPVALPVRAAAPLRSRPRTLRPVAAEVRTALSAPVTLTLANTRWRLPRWRIAGLLDLPTAATARSRSAAAQADRWLRRACSARSTRPAQERRLPDHRRAVSRSSPSATASRSTSTRRRRRSSRPRSRRQGRVARLTVDARDRRAHGRRGEADGDQGPRRRATRRSTAARRTACTTCGSSHSSSTGTLIAPGATFSFNGATGERTADKGFLEAPVIINGELQTGLGGGVCQVSTTVFNAAFEAGLKITQRTNHALYISHYPHGPRRDCQLPRPRPKFVNDTGHWLLLRTFVGSSSLTVALYGTPVHRRVETETAPLVVTAQPAVKRVPDPERFVGETSLETYGEPARSTSVRRRVYSSAGKLLSDNTWSSYYVGEPRVVIYGTKPKPKPKPKPPPPTAAAADDDPARSTPPPPTTAADDRRQAAAPAAAASPPSFRPSASDRVDEERGHARRPERRRVDAGVGGPAVGHGVPPRSIAYSKRKRAPRTSTQRTPMSRSVREARRHQIADVRLDRRGVDARLAQGRVAALEPRQVVDARELEPDEVVGVVDDPLRVGLREAHLHLGRRSGTRPPGDSTIAPSIRRSGASSRRRRSSTASRSAIRAWEETYHAPA